MYELKGNEDRFHEENRITVCAICDTTISRVIRRNSTIPLDLKHPKQFLLKLLMKVFPLYDLENHNLPTGVCTSCCDKLRRHRFISTDRLDTLIYAHKSKRLSTCSQRKPCTICSRNVAVSNKHHPNKRPVDHATIIDNPTPKKRRKRAPVADAENIPPNMLNMGDYAAIQASESSTTISTARIAGVLKERHTEASLPPKTKVYDALINRTHAFDGLFTSLELPPNTKSDDGAAVMCTDVVMLIDLIATFRGKNPKDVARIKLSGDGGQGSIKISLQVLFTDDPLLLLPHEVNEALAERHLNSGVKRTFILTLIAGVSESHDIVQWIMQHLQPERLFDTYDHAVITFPADMKFQQYLAGLQQHSARHGYLYRMWSMFSAHSRPDEPRDKRSLLKDAEEFRSAVERDPTTSPIDFNNSIHVPIQFILLSPLPLLLALPPPILHILYSLALSRNSWSRCTRCVSGQPPSSFTASMSATHSIAD